MRLVLDISSDEEEGLEGALPEPDYDRIREFLHNSDDASVDSEDVVIIHENKPELKLKSSTLVVKGGDGGGGGGGDDDDDSDDCVILESDPEKGEASVAEETNESDDLVVIGGKGQIACRDYPHARHLCAKFPFSSTPHEKHCSQCYCYVCDSLAPCLNWGTGLLTSDHCHANDKTDVWKIQRSKFKLAQSSPLSASAIFGAPLRPRHPQHSEFVPLGVINLSSNSVLPNQASTSTATCTIPSPNSIPQVQASWPTVKRSHSASTPNFSVQNQVSGPINTPIISPATNMTMPNGVNHGRSQESRSTLVSSRCQPHSISRPVLGIHSHAIQREQGNAASGLRPLLLRPHMMSSNLRPQVVRPQVVRPHMVPKGVGSAGNTLMANNSSHGSSALSNRVNMTQQHVNYHTATGLSNYRNQNEPDNVFCPTNISFYTQSYSQPASLSIVNQHTVPSGTQAYSQSLPQSDNSQNFHETRSQVNKALSCFAANLNSSQHGNKPQIRNQSRNVNLNATQSRTASQDTFQPQTHGESPRETAEVVTPPPMIESVNQTVKSSVFVEIIPETEYVQAQTVKSSEAEIVSSVPTAESDDQTMKQAYIFASSVFAEQTESSEAVQAESINASAPPSKDAMKDTSTEVCSDEGHTSSTGTHLEPAAAPYSPEKEKWKLPIRFRRAFLVKVNKLEEERAVVLPPSTSQPPAECLPCLEAAVMASSDPFKTWNAPPAPHDLTQDPPGVKTEPEKPCSWCTPENSGSYPPELHLGSVYSASRSISPWVQDFQRRVGVVKDDVDEGQTLEILHNLVPWRLRDLQLPGLDHSTLCSFDNTRFQSSAPSSSAASQRSSSLSAPSTPPSGVIFHYGLQPRLKVPSGYSLWSNQSVLDPMLPVPIPLNKVEYLSLCHYYGIVFPWNRHSSSEITRHEPLSLVLSDSPFYKFWSLQDKSDNLLLKMATLQYEHRQVTRAHQRIALRATSENRHSPFLLGSPYSCILKPQTQLRLAMSKSYQVMTQRVAKGKEIDYSDNPTITPRPVHMFPEEVEKLFEKGYVTLRERYLLWNQGENLKYWTGLYPKDKVRGQDDDAAYDVGQLGEGPSSAYSPKVDNFQIILPPPKIIYSTCLIDKTLRFTFDNWVLVLRPERVPSVVEFYQVKEENRILGKKLQKLCAMFKVNFDDL